MKKIDVGQMIVVLANLGVIAGIVFLGFELRQTRIALQDSSHLSTAELSQTSFDRLWEPGFAAINQAGMKDFSSLSDTERSQFAAYVYQRLNLWEYAFYSYRRGILDEEIWIGWDMNFLDELRTEAWQEVWGPVRQTYRASFAAHVDEKIAAQW
jgi:hypothetical protein